MGINAGGSYFPQATQTDYEKKAGVGTPQYMSMLDESGKLKAPFQFNPSNSAAFQKMSGIAMDPGLSPWASLQKTSLAEQTKSARDNANATAQGSTTNALDKLASTGGGVSGGANLWAAMQGARNATQANQNISNQQMMSELGLEQTDAQNKQQMLGQVSNTETGAEAANTQSGLSDLQNQNAFNTNRYNQQMAAWGAQKTADAQRAAQGGKK